jgi:DNA-directed RNA polymerase subunit L
MNPSVNKISDNSENNKLSFTLDGVNVSIANSIRRIILSDIPCYVFKTSPHNEDKSAIFVNTSRLNNEIIKQRLSCIPIHVNDIHKNMNEYILEVNVENKTDTLLYVTTKDFKVKNVKSGLYLSDDITREMFPPFVPESGSGEYYIDFVRLRPKISEEIPGEKIHLMCEFSIATAGDDSMFNVCYTCSYGYSLDHTEIEKQQEIKRQELKENQLNSDEIDFEIENWKLLDAKRITLKDSFDFIIQTVGIYTNKKIVFLACNILIDKFLTLKNICEDGTIQIQPSPNISENSYDIVLENDDYTIGKVLEFLLFEKLYDSEQISYCGFKKFHPHDTESIIRLTYNKDISKELIIQDLIESIDNVIVIYTKIRDYFEE